MNPITVYCGNGGDYEFERDRHYWRLWIENRIPNSGPFVVKPHEEGDKAYVIFEAEKWNDIFLLQSPEFIEWKHIKEYLNGT